MQDNLIYYTVGGDIKYIEMLKYSIKSLRLFGKYTGDILIISDNVCIDKVKNTFKDCQMLHLDVVSKGCEASVNKLKIYEYKNIQKYKKIIYLDLDILVQNDINIMFEYINNNFIFSHERYACAATDQNILGDWHGYYLFSKEEIISYNVENTKAINAGFFGFDIGMLDHFKKILVDVDKDRIIQLKNNNTGWCCEQPAVNKYMVINKIYDTKITEKVLQFATHFNPNNIKLSNKILIHFCFGVGNYIDKIDKMKNLYYCLEEEYHSS
jgi:lipopolysaccharide biosynthesis glycosyltransferase